MPALLSSTDRPLALRLRPDLVATPVTVAGATSWIVKDPLTLEHFHFSPEEFALMERLREPTSLAELAREFARQFPPRTITPPEIWSFISRLHAAGLIMSDAPGQGRELLERMHTERTRRWTMAWTQLAAIRFRGMNPDAFLTALDARIGWLFSPAAALALAAIVLLALSIVVGHFDEFRARLPDLAALADWRNVLCLLLVVGAVKVLHELGHALTCKHFGGEVPEIGLLLLVFIPCLYCDVSDAWRLPDKRRRIAISAAGIGVELLLAALATIVWWYAQPGITQLVALNVMLVTTAGTLLVNGNPLLRYDGYYILADLVDSPNLWQRSREVLRNLAARWLLGEPTNDDALVPSHHRAWLAGYAVASKLYLACVVASILWGLVVVLHPFHLEVLAYAVGLTLIGGVLVNPVSATVQTLRNPLRRRELRAGRLATIAALALAAMVAVLAWPVNYYAHAPLVLLPEGAVRVYATVDGTLQSALEPGTRVEPGQPIAVLDNPEIRLDLAQLESQYELARLRLDNLQKLRAIDPEANAQLPAARAALDDLARRLDDRRRDAERLTLTAPTAGTLIPAPHTRSISPRPHSRGILPRSYSRGISPPTNPHGTSPHTDSARLPQWSGPLLDERNRGALVQPGTLVALVGDPAQLEAVLLVDDTDVARLAPGQPVRLALDALPGRVLTGEVVEVSRRDTAAADQNFAATDSAARADLAPLFANLVPPGRGDVHYQCRVALDLSEVDATLTVGTRGQAKITAQRITLARWLLRRLTQTFRLPT